MDPVPGEVWLVRCVAVRWVADEPQPGLVDVELVDARNRRWVFRDKAPMFERVPSQLFTSGASYPVEALIACTVTAIEGGGGGRPIVTIATDKPWGLESVDGQHSFEVTADQLVRKT